MDLKTTLSRNTLFILYIAPSIKENQKSVLARTSQLGACLIILQLAAATGLKSSLIQFMWVDRKVIRVLHHHENLKRCILQSLTVKTRTATEQGENPRHR